jgi:hypothetical protein
LCSFPLAIGKPAHGLRSLEENKLMKTFFTATLISALVAFAPTGAFAQSAEEEEAVASDTERTTPSDYFDDFAIIVPSVEPGWGGSQGGE